jgi:membrane protease YdiL (CAAX protease family)
MLGGGYLPATRHPWSCVIFVLPLLLIYEVGLYLAGPGQPDVLRNGADAWLRMGLARLGLRASYWAPCLLLAVLVFWSLLRRGDRPRDFLGVWAGMAVESAVYAVGLWSLSRVLGPMLDGLGIKLTSLGDLFGPGVAPTGESTRPGALAEPAVRQVVSFIGAGIYEETLFRLLVFSGLQWVFRLAAFPWMVSGLLAAVASALVFAAAHHFGPNGEVFNSYVFLFRTLAGVYFTALYQFRGFGVAVGAHTGYDVLVGVLISS